MTITAIGTIPQWTFGDRLRKARHILGLTQREFADVLEVQYQRYSQWEADNNLPRNLVNMCERIQAETGVSAAWLAGFDVSPVPPGPGSELPHLDSNQEPCGYRKNLRFPDQDLLAA